MGRRNEPVSTDGRPVVDGTAVSSARLRAEVREQLEAEHGGRDEEVVRARAELGESLARLDSGLQVLRARLTEKAVHVAKIAGGVAAVGAALTGAAVVAWKRTAPD